MAENKKNKINLYSDLTLDDVFAIDPMEMEAGCSFLPLSDIVEKEDSFIIEMELPGVQKEDINIEVTENSISIEGIKRREKEGKEESLKYYCMGRAYGKFKRRFNIPKPFNMKEVKAKLDNGLLVIILPKLIDRRKKKIKIPVE